jgi:hypothetical protein
MLESLRGLPDGIDGVRADGKVTKRDFDDVVLPLLQAARGDHRRIRLLYELAPSFDGFTAGAVWEDARVGLQYLRLLERCAIVSESTATRDRAHAIGAMLPCPIHVFADRLEALAWLEAPTAAFRAYRLIPDGRVLVLEPSGPLSAEDFEGLAAVVDPWVAAHGTLRGLVVHLREFPGWDSVGGFIRHVQFIREHHLSVRRVALATDGRIARLAPRVAERFVKAEFKHFAYAGLSDAIVWAAAPNPPVPAVSDAVPLP